jgi:hypothetical protein
MRRSTKHGAPSERLWLALSLVLAIATWAFGQQPPDQWTVTLRYGGGTPNDAGPLGHCTATFTSDGKVKVESKGRRGVEGPSEIVVYETEALAHDQLQSIFKAADAALSEMPFKSRGANEDGEFLILERTGSQAAKIVHGQLRGFRDAPPEMKKLVALINDLLPEKERIPLK